MPLPSDATEMRQSLRRCLRAVEGLKLRNRNFERVARDIHDAHKELRGGYAGRRLIEGLARLYELAELEPISDPHDDRD